MDNKLRVAQIGCGKMAVFTMRYVCEKGGEIVSAYDIDENKIGKDITSICDKANSGVIIEDIKNLENSLRDIKPDIAIVTTTSLMREINDILMICAGCGVNAITTCEEAFYPANSSPRITADLDDLARRNNCTITGSGYQDASWGSLITTLCGTTHSIKKIRGKSSYNVEDYGIALAEVHGAGLTLDEFDKKIASNDKISDDSRQKLINSGNYSPSYMWNVNGWLCEKLGLTPLHQSQKCIPQTYKEDLKSSTLGIVIPKGNATGMSAIVTTETKEGIIIESECIGKVYGKDEFDINEWTIEGEPTTTFVISRPQTVEMTCASIVNRLQDVINAPAGYITTNHFNDISFKKSL